VSQRSDVAPLMKQVVCKRPFADRQGAFFVSKGFVMTIDIQMKWLHKTASFFCQYHSLPGYKLVLK